MITHKVQNSSSLTDYVTTHSSKALNDTRLSYGAKGLFLQAVYLFSINQFSLKALYLSNNFDSKNKITHYLNELKKYDYIKLYDSDNEVLFRIKF